MKYLHEKMQEIQPIASKPEVTDSEVVENVLEDNHNNQSSLLFFHPCILCFLLFIIFLAYLI